jgi:hypothetical protein
MQHFNSAKKKLEWSALAVKCLTRNLMFLALIASFAVIGTGQASAQLLFGSIVGTITDSSGALIPDALVTVTQAQTSEKRSGISNSTGAYVISTVPAGTYSVLISKPGFQHFETVNVEVAINTTVRVDAALRVGSQTETVNVSASGESELQTDRADVHGEVTSQSLQELPQPTRTYEGLVGLLPGVAPPSASGGGTNNPMRSMEIQANGTSGSATNVAIDGVSATNPWVQFYSTAVPSVEAVEMVNVVTASAGADQGVMNGAGIHVQIKSGTNSFHGSAYEYFENNTLKAKPYFQPVGTQKPKYIDNNFGGTLGGPIFKDKLFFFGSYEADRLRQSAGGLYTLPTPNMVSGLLLLETPTAVTERHSLGTPMGTM